MKRAALMVIITTIFVGCASCSGYPGGMTKAEYDAMVARGAADHNQPDYADKATIINVTRVPPCGICDPITRSTPDGTYTVPRQ